jgi:hypothetical protein
VTYVSQAGGAVRRIWRLTDSEWAKRLIGFARPGVSLIIVVRRRNWRTWQDGVLISLNQVACPGRLSMVVHLDLSVVSYTLSRFEIAFPPFCPRAQSQIRVAPLGLPRLRALV